MPITVFFNSLVFLIVLKKTVLDISECSKHKTKVQFLMYTFKKVLKIQNSRKIGKKISSAMRSRIFPIFLEFSFFNTFLKVCIKKNTIFSSVMLEVLKNRHKMHILKL